jgi:hypothetical protein
MDAWVEEIAELPLDFDRQRWRFFDPATGRRWILYRAGTYLVDRVLGRDPSLRVEQLADLTAAEILALTGC